MPQTIETPSGPVDFPDEMSDEDITAVLDEEYGVTFDGDIPALAPKSAIEAENQRQASLSIPDVDASLPLSEMKEESPFRIPAIAAGAMTGAEMGRRAAATLGPYSRLAQPVGALLGGAYGAAAATYGHDVATGTPPVDAALNALREGKLDMQYGLGIPGAFRVVRALGQSGARAIGITSEHTAQLAETAKNIGAQFGLIDAANWAPVRGIRTVLGVFPFVGTPFRKAGEKSQKAVIGAMDDYLNAVAPNASLAQAGIDMVEAVGKSFEEFRTVGGDLFRQADELAESGKAMVPSAQIIEAAESAVKRLDLPKLSEGIIPDTGGTEITNFIESLMKIEGEQMTIAEVRALERSLSELYQSPSITGTDARRIMKVKEGIEGAWSEITAADEAGTEAVRKAYDVAKGYWATGMKTFETATAKKFGRVDKSVFRSKAFEAGGLDEDEIARFAFNLKSAKSVKDLKAIVGQQPVLDAWRSNMDTALERSFKELDGGGYAFNFATLEQELGIAGKRVVPEALTEVLKGTGVSAKDFVRVIQLGKKLGDIPMASRFVARRAVLGGAGSAMRAMTGTAAAAAVGVASIPTAVALTVFMRMGATALTNPKYVAGLIKLLDDSVPDTAKQMQVARLMKFLAQDEAAE